MNALYFILKTSLKNTLKELKKKPATLVAYSLIALLAILMLASTFIIPSGTMKRGSLETFGIIASMSLVFFVYFGIKQGINSGNSFFRFSDVNMVFTAPISPKKILVYGFIKQLFTTLFMMLILSFQIPNLKNNFPLGKYGVLIIYVSVFLLFFSMKLIGILVYSIASKSKRIRSNMEKGLTALVIIFSSGFLIVLMQTKDVLTAANLYLNNKIFDFVPFLGWFKIVLKSSISGINLAFFINFSLIITSLFIMIYIIYKLKTDYYEDVIAATERTEQLIAAKKAGVSRMNLMNTKLRKVNHKYHGTGSLAIFYRHLLEYRKSGFFFISRSTLIMVGVGIASKYFFAGISSGSGSNDFDFKLVLYTSIYVLFFFSLQGKWAQELSKPFIYLIPSKSSSKVICATLAETLKNGLDGLILFAVSGFVFKMPIQIILLSALTYTTFSLVFTYGDVLSRRLLGEIHSKNLEMFAKMFLIFVTILPGIIIANIFNMIFKNFIFTNCLFYFITIAYNIIACAIILFFNKSIFETLEMK